MAQYIDYGEFENFAGRLNTMNEELRSKLQDIEKTINGLQGEWESKSASTIREKITGMESRFDQYYEVVNNYAKFLSNTAQQYRETENALNTKASQFI